MKCIYCKTEDQNKFKSVEHVFPQCFGVFATETPTLKECVCDDCNQYFMKHLDQIIARESLEGITRYKKGMYARESRVQQRLIVTLPDTPEMGENAGVLVWIDGQTGKIREPLPQVHFQVGDSGRYVVVKASALEGLDWKAAGYSDKSLKVLAPNPEEHQRVLKMLKDIGIDFKEKSRLPNPFEGKGPDSQFEVQIEGTIDHTVKRALLKILMNFAARYIGVEEVLKPEWDKCRNYVRFDGEPIPARISQKPFWGEESNNLRFEDDSYNIRIENVGSDVIGMLQIFNLFTYEFKIIENYNIADGKELAARFTPGKKPAFGVKGLK
jgi:hypothetical protein